MMKVELIPINTMFDARGNLSVVEGESDLPYIIKRMFYIWGNEACHQRGGHAHKALYQSFICVHGGCRLRICDGFNTQELSLDTPMYQATVAPGLWVDIDSFLPETVLIVLCSEHYDESDYIRDYDEFIRYVQA